MLMQILASLDILAGILILFLDIAPQQLLYYVGILMLFKAGYSFAMSIASQFYFDYAGIIDLLAGASLLLAWNIPYFWLFPLIKGIYSFVIGFVL